MRYAVIDLGSNTFHALVAEADEHGLEAIALDEKIAVRLGEHAFEQRSIPSAAYARGMEALGLLLERTRATGYEHHAIVATGIFREASNGRQFLAEARGRYGVAIDLLDGRDEARLTWRGVSAELEGRHRRLAVIDLGGGSLECVVGVGAIETAESLPLGVLRLRNYHRDDIREVVATTAWQAIADVRVRRPEMFALASGTARALLRLGRAIGQIGATERHLSHQNLADLSGLLGPLSPELIGELGVEPSRHDTIATGAIVLEAIVEMLGKPRVYVAKAALREGVLLELSNRSRTMTPAEVSYVGSCG